MLLSIFSLREVSLQVQRASNLLSSNFSIQISIGKLSAVILLDNLDTKALGVSMPKKNHNGEISFFLI